MSLPTPPPQAIIYEDDRLYSCLATYPITEGHTVIVWKELVADLHLLERSQYEHLMWIVEKTRDALLEALGVEKVYLMYMDEANQVHWHLIPRYDEKGYNLLRHHPEATDDFSLAEEVRTYFSLEG